MTVRIAIDAMGGDHGLPVTVPAALSFLRSHPDAEVLLTGDPRAIEARLDREGRHGPGRKDLSLLRQRVTVVPASEVVLMDDAPAQALRGKRDSSMRVCVELVKPKSAPAGTMPPAEGVPAQNAAGPAQTPNDPARESASDPARDPAVPRAAADACVSAGNTGALMAISRFVLKMLEGIDRPAIAAQIPNQTGGATTMLDLGANVDCSAQHLLQFAVMGSALVSVLEGKERPTVGLLNIGEEAIKGNDVVKEAAELIRATELNFYGNVEGNDIFRGIVDVIICDGFVGNVALKTSEGLAQMLGGFLREEFGRGPVATMMAVLSYPALKRFKRRTDHRTYNGASLIGLRGIVVKSHGSADALAFEAALRRAYDAAHNDLIGRIGAALPGAAAVAQSLAAAHAANAAKMRRRQADIIGDQAPDVRA
jgi:phosphate acyltransferase